MHNAGMDWNMYSGSAGAWDAMTAAAAASIEQPTFYSTPESAQKLDPHTEAIRMAQQKAAMRRAGGQDLADTIRNAQMKNIPAAQAEAEANAMSAPRRVRDSAAARNGQLGPESLLGTWVDPRGNTVLVMSTDAYAVRLAAILSRPPRADLHLAMRPLDDGGWTCGNSTLSAETSTAEQLHWVGPDGNWSIWMRGRE
ncbi:unnamed protein product [Prorocentrum cordatum]|uniref:Uncharacterized protein n=1 Tax=Prorocentrum cordatum TaxID=2364126 RepID=A0ABN9YH63_9DINO|nr:unnamed protein product [Polarella glacialis]